jgi:hypothetical protein
MQEVRSLTHIRGEHRSTARECFPRSSIEPFGARQRPSHGGNSRSDVRRLANCAVG